MQVEESDLMQPNFRPSFGGTQEMSLFLGVWMHFGTLSPQWTCFCKAESQGFQKLLQETNSFLNSFSVRHCMQCPGVNHLLMFMEGRVLVQWGLVIPSLFRLPVMTLLLCCVWSAVMKVWIIKAGRWHDWNQPFVSSMHRRVQERVHRLQLYSNSFQ